MTGEKVLKIMAIAPRPGMLRPMLDSLYSVFRVLRDSADCSFPAVGGADE